MSRAVLPAHRRRTIRHLFVILAAIAASSVARAQSVQASPAAIVMSAQVAQYGGSAVTQTLSITSSSGPTNFFAIPNPQVPWLRLSLSSGATPAAITVTLDPVSLSQGVYSTSITVYSGSNSVTIPVTFYVTSIGLSPQTVTFNYQANGSTPNSQSISLTGPSGTYNATASTASGGNWLQVAPASGSTPGALTALLNPAVLPGLPSGTYVGSITVTPTGTNGPPAYLPVTLVVTALTQVSVSASNLSFGYQVGGTNNLLTRPLLVSGSGNQATPYSFTWQVDPNPAGRNWLTVTPSLGTIQANGQAPVTVGFDPTGLPAGTYNGKLTLSTPGGLPATQDIAVRLVVSNTPLLYVSSSALSFTWQIGADLPAAQSVTPGATSGTLSYTATGTTANGVPWLTVSSTGLTGTPLSISVNPSGMAPGTYTGVVQVAGVPSTAGTEQVAVTLRVSNDPLVTSSVSSLIFPYQVGQAAPPAQVIKVSSTTGAPLNYTTAVSSSFLVTSGATSGTTDGMLQIQANPAGQTPGAYDGAVMITATDPATGAAAVNSPLRVPVKLYVSNTPLLLASQTSLQPFVAQIGGPNPSAQSITLNSTSPTQQLTYTVSFRTDNGGNWLFAGPITGSTPASVTFTVLPSLLSQGNYTGSVTITATDSTGAAVANTPLQIPVSLQVAAGTILAAPSSLTFQQSVGGARPAAQVIGTTSSAQALSYFLSVSTTSGGNWLSVSPGSGVTPGNATVTVDGAQLAVGDYQGTVLISAPGAAGSPLRIPVTLHVNAGSLSVAPASLTFTQAAGSSAGATLPLNVTSSPASLAFTVSTSTGSSAAWLSASPASGTAPGAVQVTANAGGLAVGSYSGTVTVSGTGGVTPVTVPVTLNVVTAQSLSVTPAALTYTYSIGANAPAAQTIQIASGGAASFTVDAKVQGSGSSWLQVSSASGAAPATISVTVNPQGLAAGAHTGTLTVTSPNAAQPVTVAVTLTVSTVAPPTILGVANAASWVQGAIAPGEAIVLTGTNIGPAVAANSQLDAAGKVDTLLAQTRVLFDGIPAPILYASSGQTSVMAPYNLVGRAATQVQVEYNGVLSAVVNQRVADTAPGVFTTNSSGTGPGVILNQNGTVNSASNPATKGTPISIYATGEGQLLPAGVNGLVTPTNGTGLKNPVLTVTATIGGMPAQVLYAGSAPGTVSGIMQVVVTVPANAPGGGAVPLVIAVGSASSQSGVTVAIQ